MPAGSSFVIYTSAKSNALRGAAARIRILYKDASLYCARLELAFDDDSIEIPCTKRCVTQRACNYTAEDVYFSPAPLEYPP